MKDWGKVKVVLLTIRFIGIHLDMSVRRGLLFLITCLLLSCDKEGMYESQPTWHILTWDNRICDLSKADSLFSLADSFQRLADSLENEALSDSAKILYHKAIASEPHYFSAKKADSLLSIADSLEGLASILENEELLDSAEIFYRMAIETEPNYYPAQWEFAMFSFSNKEYPVAESTFRACVALKPYNYWAHYYLALSLGGQDKIGEAEEELRKAIAVDSTRMVAFHILSKVLLSKGEMQEAEETIWKAIRVDSMDLNLRLELVFVLFVNQDFDEAERELEPFLRYLPNIPQVHLLSGSIWAIRNKMELAENEFSRAIELLPREPHFHFLLGGIKTKRGDLEGAQSELELAKELGGEESMIYSMLGVVYQKQGRVKEAAEAYSKAIQMDVEYFPPYDNLALLLVYEDNLDSSVILYSKALELSKKHRFPGIKDIAEDFTKALLIIGWNRCMFGDLQQAEEAIDSALTILEENEMRSPGSEKILTVNAHSLLGAVNLKKGDSEKAIEEFKKALELEPKDKVVRYGLALAYFSQRQLNEAEMAATAAIYLAGDDGYSDADSLLIEIGEARDELKKGFKSRWWPWIPLGIFSVWLVVLLYLIFSKRIRKTQEGRALRNKSIYLFLITFFSLAVAFFVFPYTKIVSIPVVGKVELDVDRIELPEKIEFDLSRINQPKIMTFPDEPGYIMTLVVDISDPFYFLKLDPP